MLTLAPTIPATSIRPWQPSDLDQKFAWSRHPGLEKMAINIPVDVPLEQSQRIQVTAVTRPGWQNARRLNFAITGFGVSHESFLPSLEESLKDRETAMVSLAITGLNAFVSKGIDLTPEILTQSYMSAILCLAQGRPKRIETIAGNSMGAMPALAAVLQLAQQNIRANYIADDPMTWDVVRDHEASYRAPLHLLLTYLASSEILLNAVHVTLGGNFIGDLFRKVLVSSLYETTNGGLTQAPSSLFEEYNHMARLISDENDMSPTDVMFSTAAEINGWRDYLVTLGAKKNGAGRISEITLPNKGIISRPRGSRVFNNANVIKLHGVLRTANNHKLYLDTRHRDSHCERSPRLHEVFRSMQDQD